MKHFLPGSWLARSVCLGGLLSAPVWAFQEKSAPQKATATKPPVILLVNDPQVGAKKDLWKGRGSGLLAVEKAEFVAKAQGAKPLVLKILGKEKSDPPANRPPTRAGEEWIQLDAQPIPRSVDGTIRLFAKGTATPADVPWVRLTETTVAETEPNNGPDTAATLGPDQDFRGVISPNKDVDCFGWVLPPGKRGVLLRWGANQSRSLLEPMILVQNEQLQLVAEWIPRVDQETKLILGKPGKYFFSIIDINDTDSEFHHYQLGLVPVP